MGSKWRKAKMALGLNTCLYVPKTLDDILPEDGARFSDAVVVSPTVSQVEGRRSEVQRPQMPTTPTPSSSGLRLPKHGNKSSKRICSICLTTMKAGQGHAIFTAECSHSFHFQCITSNVKHGNQICPVCRAKWKEVPFQSPASDLSSRRSRTSRGLPQDDGWMTVVQRLPHSRPDGNRQISPLRQALEPGVFDDDEHMDHQPEVIAKNSSDNNFTDDRSVGAIEIKTYPEVSSVGRSTSHSNFNILLHLKAPINGGEQRYNEGRANLPLVSQNPRAPIDLVTVLDVSGSMAGTKLVLLKRAMGFVIQNLGPSDRLSVIAFSSTARRLFPLRRMTDIGRQEALQAVNALISNGGTNIAEGLRKGAKVMTDRKWKSPVSSIILLSDGQDTYTITSPRANSRTDYQSLLPSSMHRNSGAGPHIPVHSFGFGADHDAVSMHSISEASGGTFSFIETESVIQDAFAQCIGGLLSVVAQELQVIVDCVNPKLHLNSIKAGNYKTTLTADARTGFIEAGDLYAEEERDFLVILDIPVDKYSSDMSLLKIQCHYKDPITKETVTLEEARNVVIQRPETTGQLAVSMAVDRQRNRLCAAETMAETRAAAKRGDVEILVRLDEDVRHEVQAIPQLVHIASTYEAEVMGQEDYALEKYESEMEDSKKRHLNLVFIGHIDAEKSTVSNTIGIRVEEDLKRTWVIDTVKCKKRDSIELARAIYAHAITAFTTKKGIWIKVGQHERSLGTRESLDALLRKAITYLSQAEVLWLMDAKDVWLAGDVTTARAILLQVYATIINFDKIWLVVSKLEFKILELESVIMPLAKIRGETKGTKHVWMKSVIVERVIWYNLKKKRKKREVNLTKFAVEMDNERVMLKMILFDPGAKISVQIFDPGGCSCWRNDGARGTNCRIHILEDKDILKGKQL